MSFIDKFAASAGIGLWSISATPPSQLPEVDTTTLSQIEVMPKLEIAWPTQKQMVENSVANFRQEFGRRVQANDYSGKWNKCFSTKSADYDPAAVKKLRTNLFQYTSSEAFIDGQPLVLIDQGHGHQTALAEDGYDPGGVHKAAGLREAKLVEPVASILKKLLEEKSDAIVVMTRGIAGEKDTLPQNTSLFNNQEVALQIRAEMASHLAEKFPNSEVIFISLHTNTGNVAGSEIYYYAPYRNGPTDSPDSKRLATTINAHYRLHPYAPRSALSGDFAVMRCTNVPAVLAELGSIDISEDRSALQRPQAIAEQLANGISAYFQQSHKIRVQYAEARKETEKWTASNQTILLASAAP